MYTLFTIISCKHSSFRLHILYKELYEIGGLVGEIFVSNWILEKLSHNFLEILFVRETKLINKVFITHNTLAIHEKWGL